MTTLQANDNVVRAIRNEQPVYFSFVGRMARVAMVELTERVRLPTFERERMKDYFIYKPRRSFHVLARSKGTMTHMAFWPDAGTNKPIGFMSASMGNPDIQPGDLIEPVFSLRVDIAHFLQLEAE